MLTSMALAVWGIILLVGPAAAMTVEDAAIRFHSISPAAISFRETSARVPAPAQETADSMYPGASAGNPAASSSSSLPASDRVPASPPSASGASPQQRAKIIRISRLDAIPHIDGLINDACWQRSEPASGFVQYDPDNGVPASEETLVWAAYDQDHIYFAFLCRDSRPDRIWAELTPRNEFESNDAITVLLDTYNDRRTHIEFTVNPKNVQKNSVETIWQSGAVVRADGWSAEIAIPFKSLRFSPAEDQVWGINFERYVHRLSERDYWTAVDRDLPLLQQFGELEGLSGVRPGHNLEFFPYAGFRSSRWHGAAADDGAEDATDAKGAAGIDVKYGFLPNVTLDLTASPDFSEVESDPFIYQLSPYENYFSEHRPFFSEGGGYFELSAGHGYGSSTNLFYSRRIDRPRVAVKLSGKTGGYSFGLLGALNEEDGLGADRAFSVVRVQKDILANSQIGLYYTGADVPGDHNRNFAFDYRFNFGGVYTVSGASVITNAGGAPGGRNAMHLFQFQRDADEGVQAMLDFQRIEPNVDVRTGFVNQIDLQRLEAMAGYGWRFDRGQLRRISVDLTGNILQDAGGDLTGQSMDLMVFTDFLSRLEIHGGIELGRRRYQVRAGGGHGDGDDDGDGNGLTWTRDFLPTGGFNLDVDWERGGFLKEITLESGWEKSGVYTDDFTRVVAGSEATIEGGLTLRPRSNFEWSFGGEWVRQTIDATGEVVFDGMAYETSLHYQISPRLFLSTRLLGETREDQYNFDFLVGYYFGAGNVVQLCYKKSEHKAVFLRESGDAITLKVSYLLRI